MLTREEELFIATRLLSRARHSSKKLENAQGKPLHPQLLRQIQEDVAECTRLALKLQGAPEALPDYTVACKCGWAGQQSAIHMVGVHWHCPACHAVFDAYP